MNINIKIDPTAFGKSGYLALCPYCLKTTEYYICCDEYKLNVLDYSTIDELCEIYDLTPSDRVILLSKIDDWMTFQSSEFGKAINAYRVWSKSGKDHKNSQHLFDAWDAAIDAYAKSRNIERKIAVDMVYRAIEAELRDERVK